jgi:hypothetical protein
VTLAPSRGTFVKSGHPPHGAGPRLHARSNFRRTLTNSASAALRYLANGEFGLSWPFKLPIEVLGLVSSETSYRDAGVNVCQRGRRRERA